MADISPDLDAILQASDQQAQAAAAQHLAEREHKERRRRIGKLAKYAIDYDPALLEDHEGNPRVGKNVSGAWADRFLAWAEAVRAAGWVGPASATDEALSEHRLASQLLGLVLAGDRDAVAQLLAHLLNREDDLLFKTMRWAQYLAAEFGPRSLSAAASRPPRGSSEAGKEKSSKRQTPSSVKTGNRREGHRVNALMVETMTKTPASLQWSIRTWGKFLGVGKSTVQETNAWKLIMANRGSEKADRLDRQHQMGNLKRRDDEDEDDLSG